MRSKALLPFLLVWFIVFPSTSLSDTVDERWRYTVAFPQVWMPSIDGQLQFENGNQVDINVDFDQILDKLTGGFMGTFYADKGNWGASLSINYLKIEDSFQTEGKTDPIFGLPLVSPHDIATTMRVSANDWVVRYRVHPSIRLTTGVRHLYTKIDMDVTKIGEGAGINVSAQLSEDNLYDWIAGVDIDHRINKRWSFLGSIDSSIYGDNDLDFNVEGYAVYRVSKMNRLVMGYRHLEIGNDVISDVDGSTLHNRFTESGPVIGWAFAF